MTPSVTIFDGTKADSSLLLRLALVYISLVVVASQLPANNPITEPWIWPLPQEWQRANTTVRLSSNLNFSFTGQSEILQSAIDRYRNLIYLKDDYPMIPYNWSTTGSEVISTLETIEVHIRDWSEELDMDTDESYTLTIPVASNTIINATTVFGALRAFETISQMVQWSEVHNSFLVPNAPWRITDFPKYKHRGLLLDTSRHYYRPRDMFKIIDTMSWNKMNVFHWHMLDSTAFPYASRAYPELAEKGSYSPAHQYDEKFIRDFVKYAKERGVRVMPEIEAPGHSTSWAYGIPEIGSCVNIQPYTGFTIQPPSGQLNIASNKTREVVHTIIDEFAELFSDSWFHASGDEVIMECWTNDTRIASYLRDRNITILQLFEEFVSDMQSHIYSHNKTVMVWQEMLLEYNFTLPVNTVIQVWVGSEGVKESTRRGYKTVVSSSDYWYLDVGYGKPRSNPFPHVAGAGYNHWNRVYSYDMRTNLTEEETNLLVGGEVAMWGELADETNFEAKIWPRASAFAERLWSGYENPAGEKIESADAILRLLPWRERMVLRGTMASPLNQGFCTRNPLDCFQPDDV
ncbi:hypothetical protein HA402_015068 [Bradysia odoriphaga]|nr:hypothetical protein HA402_015068 [Bradysia odoriphaga]